MKFAVLLFTRQATMKFAMLQVENICFYIILN